MKHRPLFVPLKREYFDKFKCGAKTIEYRPYGPRWNGRTCLIDRDVVLSLGYSGERIAAKIASIVIMPRSTAPETAQSIYPQAQHIIAIHLKEIATA